MNELPFQKFINLVSFDQKINALEQNIQRLSKELHEREDEVTSLDDQLAQAKSEVVASKKNVDTKELEMQELDNKQKEKQKLLDRITNQREYQSAYQEIDRLKKNQYELEETLLSAWSALEATTRNYLQQKQDLEKKRDELHSSIADFKRQQEELKKELQEHTMLRSEKELGIPQEWLEKYAIMRKSVTNPVVPVKNNSCSACFYLITQQDSARLRRHAMLQCKECYRFLYME